MRALVERKNEEGSQITHTRIHTHSLWKTYSIRPGSVSGFGKSLPEKQCGRRSRRGGPAFFPNFRKSVKRLSKTVITETHHHHHHHHHRGDLGSQEARVIVYRNPFTVYFRSWRNGSLPFFLFFRCSPFWIWRLRRKCTSRQGIKPSLHLNLAE